MIRRLASAPLRKSGLELDGRAFVWLAATLVLALLPHMQRLPAWLSALTLVALLWKWLLVRWGRPPGKWMLIGAALLVTAGILVSFGGVHGRVAGTALLVAMLSLKLVETRTRRDASLVVLMCYFLIATSFLFEQGIPVAIYMLTCIVVGTMTLMSLGATTRQAPIRRRLSTSLSLMALAVPIAAVLFVLFPRLAGPLWSMPEDPHSGVTGISDSMTPGRISQLTRSDEPAFRVKFDGEPPGPEYLYWRGPVLWNYDGQTWTQGRRQPRQDISLQTDEPPISYTVTLEEHGKHWLFALDLPIQPPPRAYINASGQMLSIDPVITTRQYQTRSVLRWAESRELRRWEKYSALQLPEGYNPGALKLGNDWRQSFGTDREIVNQALQMFREQPFRYTLSPPRLGQHAVDEFLFEVRAGFCEMYAASFVTLMRAAGIPARVVTGYLGGEINSMGDYMIVRQSDAHAWAEVWLSGVGWMRVDPTAAVAPERVERGLDAAIPLSESLPFLSRRGDSLWRDLRLAWDAVDNYWNQWVLGYGPELQNQLLGQFGVAGRSWQMMALMFGLIGLLLVPIVWSLLRQRPMRSRHDPVLRQYYRLCHQLARAGIERLPHEAPMSFLSRAASLRPAQGPLLLQAGQLINALRYAPRPPPNALRQLQSLVARLRAKRLRAQT